jgi:hypothetical protein
MKLMPSAKSRHWFFWMPLYGLLLWLLLGIHRFAFLGQSFDIVILLRLALFAFIVSGVLYGFGWYGARLVWLITTIGISIGLVLMFVYTNRDMSGWEDLAGFLTFVVFMLGGFTVGLLAEVIYFLMKRQLKKP